MIILAGFVSYARSAEFPELDQYIKDALSSNLKIKQMERTISEKRSARDEARSGFFPSLDFKARYTRAGGGREIVIDPREFLGDDLPPGIELGDPKSVRFLREEEHDTRFNLSQPLFTGGMTKSRYMAREMELMAAKAEHDAVRENIIFEVSHVYLRHLMAIKLEEISGDNLSLAEKHLEVAEKLYEAEKVPMNDVYRAEVQVSSARQSLAEAETLRKLTGLSFKKLLDLEEDSPIRLPEKEIDLGNIDLGEKFDYNLDECLKLAAENRSELSKLRYNRDALDYLRKVYSAEYFPHLSLGAAYGWEGEKYKFDGGHDYWTISLFLDFKIFDAGGRKARVRKVEAQKSRIDYLYSDLEKSISLEVRQAFYELENHLIKWESARDQHRSAKENFRITEIQYKNGLTSQILFLDAQNSYQKARSNLIIVHYEIVIAMAALDKACGRGLARYVDAD